VLKKNKFVKLIIFLLNSFWAVPCAFLVLILKPYLVISFQKIYVGAFGHFLLEGAEAYEKFQRKSKKEKRLFFYSNTNEITNIQWAKMLERNLPIYPFFGYYVGKVLSVFFPKSINYIESTSIIHQSASTHFFSKKENTDNTPINFSASENSLGYEWLNSQGWKKGEPFICLISRDQAYDNLYRDNNVTRTSHRNVPINEFKPAVEWLISQGVWVFRMGLVAKEKLEITSPKFVDYAFCRSKSALLDIWLFANCDGIISTATGPDVLGILYKKPILHIGLSPLIGLWDFAQTLTIPKNLLYSSDKRLLNLNQTLDFSWDPAYLPRFYKNAVDKNYQDWGIQVVDPTALEILSGVKEFWQRMNGTWVDLPGDSELQTAFWNTYKSHPYYQINHNWKHPQALMGRDWLHSVGIDYLH
jgi:putative glycosyltransferase (TIGR04372 family)